jgi:hypothetical protein
MATYLCPRSGHHEPRDSESLRTVSHRSAVLPAMALKWGDLYLAHSKGDSDESSFHSPEGIVREEGVPSRRLDAFRRTKLLLLYRLHTGTIVFDEHVYANRGVYGGRVLWLLGWPKSCLKLP